MHPGTCKHYNGTIHEKCDCGVCYKDVTTDHGKPSWGLRIPCHNKPIFDSPRQLAEHERRGKCEKYEEPSEKDMADFQAMIDDSDRRMRIVTAFVSGIRKGHKGKDWSGTEKCPVCGNKLHLRLSGYNGHMMGRCETLNCVNWIE